MGAVNAERKIRKSQRKVKEEIWMKKKRHRSKWLKLGRQMSLLNVITVMLTLHLEIPTVTPTVP